MPWTSAKREHANTLHKTAYLPMIGMMAHSCTVPFWWHSATEPIGRAIAHNGTAVFVATEERDFFVTCAHVYSAWARDRSAGAHVRCQVGGAVIEPERGLIARSDTLDLATFKASARLASTAGATLYRSACWPARAAEVGEVLLVGGFPGLRRREAGDSTSAAFDFAWFLTLVEDVSADRVVCCLRPSDTYSPQGATLEEGFTFGGTSGGPILRLTEGDQTTLELVGFVREYSSGLDVLVATPASRIRGDGTIV